MATIYESFDEIIWYQYHYFNKILTFNRESSSNNEEIIKTDFIKYLYGPYLVMHNEASRFSRLDFLKMDQDVAVMVNMANILKCIENKPKIAELKNVICNAINNISDSYPHKEIFFRKCMQVLEDLKDLQYSEKLLESSILNCAPIVPYSKVIRKPGDESSISNTEYIIYKDINIRLVLDYFRKYNTKEDLVNEVIKPLLVINIVDILKYSFYTNTPFFTNRNNKKISIIQIDPSILKYDPKLCTEEAYRYFLTVYLAYIFEPSEYNDVANKLEDLINIINNINNGNRVNVERAIECMSSLTNIVD